VPALCAFIHQSHQHHQQQLIGQLEQFRQQHPAAGCQFCHSPAEDTGRRWKYCSSSSSSSQHPCECAAPHCSLWCGSCTQLTLHLLQEAAAAAEAVVAQQQIGRKLQEAASAAELARPG
jgi:hypothetical protein